MSDQPQRWRQADIDERDARIKDLETRLSTAAIEAEALERWRVRAERAESRLEALRSVAYDAITRLADQMTVETEHLWPCLVNLHAMVQPTAVERHDSNG